MLKRGNASENNSKQQRLPVVTILKLSNKNESCMFDASVTMSCNSSNICVRMSEKMFLCLVLNSDYNRGSADPISVLMPTM